MGRASHRPSIAISWSAKWTRRWARPVERLMADPLITEIMVVDADTTYIERAQLELSEQRSPTTSACAP
jgi:Flp pilus assembly CpaF family ATPase